MLYLTLPFPPFLILIIFHSIGNIQTTKGYELMSMENKWKALHEHRQNALKYSNEGTVEFTSINAQPADFVDIDALPLRIDVKKAKYDPKPLLFYYEVKILHKGNRLNEKMEGGIQMGFEKINSVDYFKKILKVMKSEEGSTFGCGLALDFNANKFEVFYTKNGQFEGTIQLRNSALDELHQIRPYACIFAIGTKIEANFNGEFQYKFEEFALVKKED